MVAMERAPNQKGSDNFWQKLVLPEEDRRRLYPTTTRPGGYRWWRSANVVDLETYRRRSNNRVKMT
jgi:hypothetical protein